MGLGIESDVFMAMGLDCGPVAAPKQGRIGEGGSEGEKSLKTADFHVSFVVPGQPVGKGRPRASRTPKGVRLHTPDKTVNYEALVATAAQGAMRDAAPIEDPCEVLMEIRLAVPLSWSAKKRNQAFDGVLHPTKKPDMDNVVKAIFDAINGVVWQDDVQVVRLIATKRYGRTPGVTVAVRSVEGEW